MAPAEDVLTFAEPSLNPVWMLAQCMLFGFWIVGVLSSWGWICVRKTNQSRVLLGVTLRAVRQVRLHTEPPEMLQWILTLIMRHSAGLMAKKNKQVNQKFLEMELVQRVQQGVVHKQLRWGAAGGWWRWITGYLQLTALHRVPERRRHIWTVPLCPSWRGKGRRGLTDHWLTQLLILIGFQYQRDFEESFIPFTVELCWEILLSYYYLTDLLITNYHLRVISSLPC